MTKKISKERKVSYYIGIGLQVIGFILFISVFFTFADPHIDPFNEPSNPMGMAPVGFIFMIVGGIMSTIAKKGTAGSGLVLDPDKARKDLEPYSRQVGGMISDALEEVKSNKETKEIIKIRCKNCEALNEEDASFCKKCGEKI